MGTRRFHASLVLARRATGAVVAILAAHLLACLILPNFGVLIQLKNPYFLPNYRYVKEFQRIARLIG